MESIKQGGSIRHIYCKYYRVNKKDTTITEISVNDFKPLKRKPTGMLTLQPGTEMFYLYTDIGQTMEKAKAGAQAYIEELISRGEEGRPELLQYRMDHYEDLNINLVETNIEKEESEMLADLNFEYKPYKINPENIPDDQP